RAQQEERAERIGQRGQSRFRHGVLPPKTLGALVACSVFVSRLLIEASRQAACAPRESLHCFRAPCSFRRHGGYEISKREEMAQSSSEWQDHIELRTLMLSGSIA